MAPPVSPDTQRLITNAEWLAKLRWVAVAGQLLTIFIVAGPLGIRLPLEPLLGMVVLTSATNVALQYWIARNPHGLASGRWGARMYHALLGGLMVLDLLTLTVMLELTGGPTNPFVLFYFVNLALAGILLPARWAWLLAVMATAALGLIEYTHRPLPPLRDADRLESIQELGRVTIATGGTLVAFATCGSVIVSFTTWLTRELRRNQEARSHAEQRRARSEKLEALGTLAGGAAHELASPLSTIAVVVNELEHDLAAYHVGQDVTADVQLIRSELDRCRTILDRMAITAGRVAGEAPEQIDALRLMRVTLDELPAGESVDVTWGPDAQHATLTAPVTALAQAIRAVVQNALDASPADEIVRIHARRGRLLTLAVRDAGPGMPPEVLARVGEPFFTTKQPGQGMGLGLFLARSVFERLGGDMKITSAAGEGTLVEIRLPL